VQIHQPQAAVKGMFAIAVRVSGNAIPPAPSSRRRPSRQSLCSCLEPPTFKNPRCLRTLGPAPFHPTLPRNPHRQ
jgi:hypothetical protein